MSQKLGILILIPQDTSAGEKCPKYAHKMS